jgi:hypothetical protein
MRHYSNHSIRQWAFGAIAFFFGWIFILFVFLGFGKETAIGMIKTMRLWESENADEQVPKL